MGGKRRVGKCGRDANDCDDAAALPHLPFMSSDSGAIDIDTGSSFFISPRTYPLLRGGLDLTMSTVVAAPLLPGDAPTLLPLLRQLLQTSQWPSTLKRLSYPSAPPLSRPRGAEADQV